MSTKNFIIRALTTLGLLDKYIDNFEDEGVDDSVVEEWLQNPALNELRTVISIAGHRTKFTKAFQESPGSCSVDGAASAVQQNGAPTGNPADEIIQEFENLALKSTNSSFTIRPPPTEIYELPQIPEPIQILDFVKTKDHSTPTGQHLEMILHRDRLWAILNKVGRRQIAILSIAGPSRKGKSFILGFMIRYLKSIQNASGGGGDNDESDDITSDWMGWKRPDEPLKGFSWRNGYERETSGIWMWSEPFHVTSCDGRDFSIILMDTQGVFDEHTSQREWSTIVGLSLLTSSCLIFNIFTDLQEESLQALENFMAFGLLAVEQKNKDGDVEKPFQRLTFLIRDWNNPDEFPYGEKGGKSFLDKKLDIKQSHKQDHKRIRQQLVQCFDQLECFLMPEPGENAKKITYTGCLNGLDQKFAKFMEKFISGLLNIDEFPVKSIGGNELNGIEFFYYFENYVEIFKSEETPKPRSLFEITKLTIYAALIDKSFNIYTSELNKKLRSKQFFTDSELDKYHQSSIEKTIKLFEKSKKMGTPEDTQQCKNQLDEKINHHFTQVKEKNEREREKVAQEAVKSSIEKFRMHVKESVENSEIDDEDCFDADMIENLINGAKTSALEYFCDSLGIEKEENENHEFQQQQTELESSIEKASSELKMMMEVQRGNSERILKEEIEQLLKNYKEKVNEKIENKYIPSSQLEKMLEKEAKEIVKSFQSKRSAFTLYEPFNTKLMEQVLFENDDFSKMSEKESAKMVLEIEKQISDNLKLYREQVSGQINPLKLAEEHEKQRESAVNELSQFLDSVFDTSENENEDEDENCEWNEEKKSLKTKYSASLWDQIQKSFEEMENQLQNRLDNILKEIDNKETESLKMYSDEMDKFLQSNEACPESELENVHAHEKAEAVSNLQKSLDEITSVNSTPEIKEKVEAALENFMEKVDKYYEESKQKNKQQREHQESKAKNELSAAVKSYETELKKIADDAKNPDEFKKRDAELRKNTATTLTEELEKINLNNILKAEMIQELEAEIEDSFTDISDYFEMKQEEDQVAVQGALITSRKFYNDEMQKFVTSKEFFHPKELTDFSENTLETAVDQCKKKTTALTPSQEKQLKFELTSSFRRFEQDNLMKIPQEPAIGIDLGTTYSCVAVYIGNQVKIIPNTQGKNTTPSYVAFAADGSVCIGEPAKDKAHTDPKNTIFDAKRLIGRKFDDDVVQRDISLWPFEVVNERGVSKIRAQGKLYHPEQISAEILKYLKSCAETFLGVPVKNAVITVPAYFKDGQREATRDAGVLAGLNVLRIINEPTAAAIAYKLQQSEERQRNVLIFDLGGGTFDVAVVTSSGGGLDVEAVGGDTHLGGEDFDNQMLEFCISTFKGQTSIDLKQQGQGQMDKTLVYRALQRIRRDCEKKKINLSISSKETVQVDVIVRGHDLSVPVTRAQFEQMNQPNFNKCIQIVEEVLRDAKLDKSKIDEIVLVGGSTRIPKIQEMLKSYFCGKSLNHRINPDEAVAVGAGFEAAVLMGQKALEKGDFKAAAQAPKGISSNDVQPLSLGIEIEDGVMSVLIPRQSKIPIEKSNVYATTYNNQTSVQIVIYEGENPIAAGNNKVGEFYLNGIPSGKAGQHNVKVTMKIDHEGITQITATCVENGVEKNLTVRAHKQRLSDKDIQKLMGS